MVLTWAETNTSSTRFFEVPELPDSKCSDPGPIVDHFCFATSSNKNLTCSGYGPPGNHGTNPFLKTAAVTVYD